MTSEFSNAGSERLLAGNRRFLVTGTGRSGTSLLAGLLNQAGFFSGDDLYPGREANPLGFFENADINGLNEAIQRHSLGAAGGDGAFGRGHGWLISPALQVDCRATEEHREQVRDLVAGHPMLAIKDPRFCFTASVWLEELPEAELLCVFRPPATVLESMRRELLDATYLHDMRISTQDLKTLWCRSYIRLIACWARGVEAHFLSYGSLLEEAGLARLEGLVATPIARAFSSTSLDRSRTALALAPFPRTIMSLLGRLEQGVVGALRHPRLAEELVTMEAAWSTGKREAAANAEVDPAAVLDQGRATLRKDGDAAAAAALARKVLALRPSLAGAHLLLGQALMNTKDFAGAWPHLEFACVAQVENPWPLLSLARLFDRTGNRNHAVSCARAAGELAPENTQVREGAAQLCSSGGE